MMRDKSLMAHKVRLADSFALHDGMKLVEQLHAFQQLLALQKKRLHLTPCVHPHVREHHHVFDIYAYLGIIERYFGHALEDVIHRVKRDGVVHHDVLHSAAVDAHHASAIERLVEHQHTIVADMQRAITRGMAAHLTRHQNMVIQSIDDEFHRMLYLAHQQGLLERLVVAKVSLE